jgi:hypothetical protein
MKYLVDSLQRYENDYGNALCPVQNEPDQSFMGDHTLLRPVTVHEFRLFGTTIMSALKTHSESESTACSQLNTVPGHGLLNPLATTSESIMPTSSSELSTTEQNSTVSTSPSPAPAAVTNVTEQTAAVSLANTIPLTGVCIPDLPRSRGGWHIALRQWYKIDPKTGYALKDWPDAWFKESMRSKTAAKRSQRALIAHEYER